MLQGGTRCNFPKTRADFKIQKNVELATNELMKYMETFRNKTEGVCLYRTSKSFVSNQISVTKARKVVEDHIKGQYKSKTKWQEDVPNINVTNPDSNKDAAEGDTK